MPYNLKKNQIERNKKYYRNHRNRLLTKLRKRRQERPKYFWAYDSIKDHQRRGFIVEINVNELESLVEKIDVCPICKQKLDWSFGTKRGVLDTSPTLDRADNGKILRVSNTQIICNSCDRTKSNRTMKEFVDYCRMIVATFPSET